MLKYKIGGKVIGRLGDACMIEVYDEMLEKGSHLYILERYETETKGWIMKNFKKTLMFLPLVLSVVAIGYIGDNPQYIEFADFAGGFAAASILFVIVTIFKDLDK